MGEEVLTRVLQELLEIKQTMATKDDLVGFTTKKDLEKFATKEDLQRFATKEDLQGFATKEDVADIPYIKTAVNELSERMIKLENRVSNIEENMATKEDLKYIYFKLSEHDRSIFKLQNQHN